MSLKDRVTLYGHLSGDAMNDFWPGKGVILSTSLHEGHPVGIMEGMARGLTPIVHYFPDADEFYRPDNLFRTVYEGGLKIQGFIRSNNPRREIIERGFTLNEQARKIESFIDEVTA
jgi:hypothetical protein